MISLEIWKTQEISGVIKKEHGEEINEEVYQKENREFSIYGFLLRN